MDFGDGEAYFVNRTVPQTGKIATGLKSVLFE
jgi:hypothetical protein